jgi:hypothetical protein
MSSNKQNNCSVNNPKNEQDYTLVQKNKKKSYRKAGKTVLIKSVSGAHINFDSIINNFEGIVNKSDTKSQTSIFLTFDTIDNALKVVKQVKYNNKDYIAKFSYYQIYFTINELNEDCDYNEIKKNFSDYIESKTDSNVLYCKFYRKDNKYIGCGDFTIDTLEGMNILLNKELGNKEYSFDINDNKYNGVFYRYNNKKNIH